MVLTGLFATGFTITLLVVSLKTVADDVGTSVSVMSWVITGPLLAFGVVGPAFGKAGDKVLVRLKVKGTHTGPLGEMAATGKKIDIDVLDLFQFKDGVLVEHWALLDNLGMLKQLGAAS